MSKFDLLICGAGPVGCLVAERAARVRGWKVLIVEKRSHPAGNCFDQEHESGVLIHRYGPHYFRTNNQTLLDLLSEYTEWIPGNYIVKSFSRGEHFPFPINLDTLEQFFGRSFTPNEAEAFLREKAANIASPANSEEFVLSRVGPELYEAFYKGYTLKQWEIHPKDLDPSVCGRIPVRFNRDNRYVDHQFQLTPKAGFTAMFSRMIAHPGIELRLNCDFHTLRGERPPTVATVYTGPIDEYFGHCYGRLPWRSLEFDFREYQEEFRQACVQINYPNDFDYTRSVEIKHVTGQNCPNTVISYEYSRSTGDPYYPVPRAENEALYQRYRALALDETKNKRVFFAGRLASYRYFNMDQVMEEALRTFEQIQGSARKT